MVVSTLQRLKKHSPLPNLFLGLEMGNRNSFIRGYYPLIKLQGISKKLPLPPLIHTRFCFWNSWRLHRPGHLASWRRQKKTWKIDGVRWISREKLIGSSEFIHLGEKSKPREFFKIIFKKNYIYIHIIS